jgi:hypothetical protein
MQKRSATIRDDHDRLLVEVEHDVALADQQAPRPEHSGGVAAPAGVDPAATGLRVFPLRA